MQIVNLVKKINANKMIGTVPQETDYDTVIKPPAKLIIKPPRAFNGQTVGVYLTIPDILLKITREIAEQADASKGVRTYGLPTLSAIFGGLPRIEIRQNYCRLTRNSVDQQELFMEVLQLAESISEMYRQHFPNEHRQHMKLTGEIIDEWLMPSTPFSTVNFNRNHAIKYHQDRANQPKTLSNVLIVKKDVEGGLLVLPEYRLALSQDDGALILFNGQSIIHGVTPLRLLNENAYRCSIVFYTLNGMKNCYPFAEELERAKQERTRIEDSYRTPESVESVTGSIKQMEKTMAKQKKRVATLVSGGMDSIAMHFLLESEGWEAVPIYVDYDQKIMPNEMEVIRSYGLNPVILKCPMDDVYEHRFRGLKPLRNMIFVVKVAAWASLNGIRTVAVGATLGDLIPDMNGDFFQELAPILSKGLGKKMELLCPFGNTSKADIIRKAVYIGLDLEKSWSCFIPGKKQCGRCKSCLRREAAFVEVRNETQKA